MKTIVTEYLGLVDRIAATIPLPSIRSLHLPPDEVTGKLRRIISQVGPPPDLEESFAAVPARAAAAPA